MYQLKAPFSEPETQAHRDHQSQLTNKLAYLTFHAFSEFIIFPYSSSTEAEAANKQELKNLAYKMQQSIKNVNGKTYNYGEGATRIVSINILKMAQKSI